MVSTIGRTRGSSWWLGWLVLAVILGASEGSAQVGGVPDTTGQLRPLTTRAAALLAQGRARSATCARLLETLEQSDLLVIVETTSLRIPGRLTFIPVPSQLTFTAATPAGRWIRITLQEPETDNHLIGWLAHELQHAVEVARTPNITNASTLAAYYAKHGEPTITGGFCTREAQRVGAVVLAELRAAPRPQ